MKTELATTRMFLLSERFDEGLVFLKVTNRHV